MKHTSFIVVDRRDGRQICDCGSLEDAQMMLTFDPGYREIQTRKYILDQVVDVTSVGLEPDKQLRAQQILPDRQQEPLPNFG